MDGLEHSYKEFMACNLAYAYLTMDDLRTVLLSETLFLITYPEAGLQLNTRDPVDYAPVPFPLLGTHPPLCTGNIYRARVTLLCNKVSVLTDMRIKHDKFNAFEQMVWKCVEHVYETAYVLLCGRHIDKQEAERRQKERAFELAR